VKHVLSYLRGTLDVGITYGSVNAKAANLIGYSDADWGGDVETRKSTGGYVFTLNGGPISWSSKRQSTVALSSTEAEYMAMTQAAKEAAWLRLLLTNLGIYKGQETIPIHVDNRSAIAMGINPEFHQRTKHIDIQYHYVRQEIEAKRISTPYIETSRMLADGLTKPLAPPKFAIFTTELHLTKIEDA